MASALGAIIVDRRGSVIQTILYKTSNLQAKHLVHTNVQNLSQQLIFEMTVKKKLQSIHDYAQEIY